MKKVFAFILLFSIMLLAAGCNSGKKHEASVPAETVKETAQTQETETSASTAETIGKTETSAGAAETTGETKASAAEAKTFEDYVVLKKETTSDTGNPILVPELKLDSEITQEINSSIDSFSESAYNSDWVYGQYYAGELNDKYLTFYVVQNGINSTRMYLLYTIDLEKEKVLSNDDIIALVSDDPEAFYDAWKQELKKQEDYTYPRSYSELEAKNENIDRDHVDWTPSEDDYAAMYEMNDRDNMMLGYLGNNRLLGVATFRPCAGPAGMKHIFEFEYRE